MTPQDIHNEILALRVRKWCTDHLITDGMREKMSDIIHCAPSDMFSKKPEQVLRWAYTQALRKEGNNG